MTDLIKKKVLFYSAKDFEIPFIEASVSNDFEYKLISDALSPASVSLADDFDAISIFTGDDASAEVIKALRMKGIQLITTRAAGYDNIDIATATACNMQVTNVPEYSPHAIAEHAVALIMALNRKLIIADQQVHHQDFTVGKLVGFDLYKKKVGVIGTGRIGRTFAKLMRGFECQVFAYDVMEDAELKNSYQVTYASLEKICSDCDIISIHLPLNEKTKYLIDERFIDLMRTGVMLINTSRGGVVKTADVLNGLTSGKIGYFGSDVYEYEKGIFFYDHSGTPIKDKTLLTLMSLHNVLITPHQAFATNEALTNIAVTTVENIQAWLSGTILQNKIIEKHI